MGHEMAAVLRLPPRFRGAGEGRFWPNRGSPSRRRDSAGADTMSLFPTSRWVSSWACCAVLVGCASTDQPAAPTAVRTAPPQGYEKTINNFLAFRIRGPRGNSQIVVGQPEPGDCALDGYARSIRGWVVPVGYETRTGEVGKEPIKVSVKPYYFWFLGDTIAGVTPRIELCPGLGATFTEPTPPLAAALPAAAAPAPARPDAQRGADVGRLETSKENRPRNRVKTAKGPGHEHGRATKKTGKPSVEGKSDER